MKNLDTFRTMSMERNPFSAKNQTL